jgi:hypothetical protein
MHPGDRGLIVIGSDPIGIRPGARLGTCSSAPDSDIAWDAASETMDTASFKSASAYRRPSFPPPLIPLPGGGNHNPS